MSTLRNPPMPEKSDEEIERDRLEGLEQAKKNHGDGLYGFRPGGYGCHEAFHTSHILEDDVARHLLAHPAIIADPVWYRLATRAHDALFELYQQMGAGHLSVVLEATPTEPNP